MTPFAKAAGTAAGATRNRAAAAMIAREEQR